MIRRDLIVDRNVARWVLFRQPHHAELSATIAAGWQTPQFAPLEPHDEVHDAIRSHDEGWHTWEERPQVRDGRPVAFDEMDLADALPIWRASILQGLPRSPLVAYAIAGHFASLLREFGSWEDEPSERSLAESFLAWADSQQNDWLAAWQHRSPANTTATADRAVRFVRLFDALSLWLLCAERTESQTFETPDGPKITFTPASPGLLVVTPWPYATPTLQLSASGTAVPAISYSGTEELLAAPSHPMEFAWQLRPA